MQDTLIFLFAVIGWLASATGLIFMIVSLYLLMHWYAELKGVL